MKKIGDVTSTADKNGEWTNGNVAAGIAPTILEAGWLNSVQREILGVLTKAGIPQDKNNDTQLAEAISAIISGGNYATKTEVNSKLAKDQNGADIPDKPKFIENLGLDIALANKQPKDTTLTDLSGKNIAQLLDYLGLAAAGNTSGNLALIGNTKNQEDKCAVIVKTGSNANGKYRIWSDGSIDMWGNGISNANGDALVNYPITLPAAAQNVTTTPLLISSSANRPTTSVMLVTDLTTATKATFIVKRSDGATSADGFYWSVNYAAF